MQKHTELGVWFIAVRAGSGVDIFTQRLSDGLNKFGVRSEITWLPHRAEYVPWAVRVPKAPSWANIVHINTWLHPRFIPQELPVVATLHHSIHDSALHPYKGWARAAYHRFWITPIEKRVLRRAQAVVAVSQFAADMARRKLCDVPIRIIPNAIDTEYFYPSANKAAPNYPFRLLYVGSWMARKGVDLFEPIMKELGADFVLHYTCGSDTQDFPSNMINIGRLKGDEVLSIMQQADALLFPSRSEGLPLVVMEAMACGLPVICSDSASLPEIVDHGITGLICRTNSVDDFVKSAHYLKSHEDVWRKMRDAARAKAITDCAQERLLAAYHQVYFDVESSARTR